MNECIQTLVGVGNVEALCIDEINGAILAGGNVSELRQKSLSRFHGRELEICVLISNCGLDQGTLSL